MKLRHKFIGFHIKGDEKIVQTAFRVDGRIYPSGPVHNPSAVPEGEEGKPWTSGFLTNRGRFLDRYEASEFVTGQHERYHQYDSSEMRTGVETRYRKSYGPPRIDYRNTRFGRLAKLYGYYLVKWEESQHPRGQPENAGQFVSGQGTTAVEAPEVKESYLTSAEQANPEQKKEAEKEGDRTGGTEEPIEKPGKSYDPPPQGEKIVEPPCCLNDPDPTEIDKATGVSKTARVGVGAMDSPPPPKEIPRLPNLTENERAAESFFAEQFIADPDKLVNHYLEQLKAGKIGDAPNIFNTDDAKLLSPHYNPQGADEDTVKNARSTMNTAVHQTANAVAKRAFVSFLDTVVSKLPEEKKVVLVTSGGCAAGKGYALKNIPQTANLANEAGAIWDAAGEQNADENPWVLQECEKRGIKTIFAFVHANPLDRWENPKSGVVERAGKVGRMVDARVYADSYAVGAKNFKAFMDKQKTNDNSRFFVLNNAAGATPQIETDFPKDALDVDGESLYANCLAVMDSKKENLKPAVYRGGTMGRRIWGRPQVKGANQ